MILVLDIDGYLSVFPTVAEAESHLEAIDIENGECEFCSSTGQEFVGEITRPVTRFRAGQFRLKPSGVPDKAILDSILVRARASGKNTKNLSNLPDALI